MTSVPYYNPGAIPSGGGTNGFIGTDLLVAGNVTASKKVNVGTDLTVAGNGTVSGTLGVAGAVSSASVTTSGNASVGGTLNATGAVVSGTLVCAGLTASTTASVGTLNATNARITNHPVVTNPIALSIGNLQAVTFVKNGFVSVPLSGALATQFATGGFSYVNYINPGTSRFQPPVAGLWYFNYTQQANFGTNAHISAQLQANNTDGSSNLFGAFTFCSRSTGTVQFPVSVSGVALCNGTSDYINVGIYAYTDSASASGFTYSGGGLFQAILLQKTS